MEILEFLLNIKFWRNVYLVSKWIFITLSAILIVGIIWLLYKISGFRQKLDVSSAYKKYVQKPEPVESKEPIEKIVKSQWQAIVAKAESESEKEWKLAVIEADALMDLVLKRSGFKGETMKERLKSIAPDNLPSLDKLWATHKIRNQIAHSPDFSLQKKEAMRMLKIYKQALQELNII